jgi:antitoxin component of MazEF toxin-antitoxin module
MSRGRGLDGEEVRLMRAERQLCFDPAARKRTAETGSKAAFQDAQPEEAAGEHDMADPGVRWIWR